MILKAAEPSVPVGLEKIAGQTRSEDRDAGERLRAMGEQRFMNRSARNETRAKVGHRSEQAKPTKEVRGMTLTKEVLDRQLRSFGYRQVRRAEWQDRCSVVRG
jgi:hypothetical protein